MAEPRAQQQLPPHRSPATWVATAATALLTVLLAVPATLSLLRATGVLGVDVEQSIRDRTLLVGIANTESSLRIAEGWLAAVTLPLAAVGFVVTVGLLLLRPWAREAGIGVLGLSGAALALLSLQGLLQDTPGRNSVEGMLAGLAVVGTAGLLLSPACRDDVDRAETRKRVAAMRTAQAAREGEELTRPPRG